MENISSLLFDTLDYIGYNKDIIKIRRNYWQEMANVLNARNANESISRFIFAGSKAEGITSFYQSDVDIMSLFGDAICASDAAATSNLQNMTVLHADKRNTPPGYTRLKLVRRNGAESMAVLRDAAFESENEDIYLSSSIFAVGTRSGLQRYDDSSVFGEITGPAVPINTSSMNIDGVFAICCFCPEFLQAWASRPRHNNWPPAEVIQEASSLLAQVVPVGSKGSDDQWREWRFCFIQSELKLTHSLNETQIKLYILLKMVAKEILSNVCSEISSYIMKNVTFWVSEIFPGHVFRKENMFPLLVISLQLLKSSIRAKFLPYYMIPGRNLLAERLTGDSRLRLYGLIEELIHEGPQFLLRFPKIRNALTIQVEEPTVIRKYGAFRNSVELLDFLDQLLKLYRANQSDMVLIGIRAADNVLPEWRMLAREGIPMSNLIGVVSERVKNILS